MLNDDTLNDLLSILLQAVVTVHTYRDLFTPGLHKQWYFKALGYGLFLLRVSSTAMTSCSKVSTNYYMDINKLKSLVGNHGNLFYEEYTIPFMRFGFQFDAHKR